MKSVFVRKAKNLIGPVFSGPIKAAAETLARPEAATAAHEAVPHAGAEATQARRILDRIVGYQVSKDILWRSIYPGLSAGRVQTVALRLICEREEDIRRFQAEEAMR